MIDKNKRLASSARLTNHAHSLAVIESRTIIPSGRPFLVPSPDSGGLLYLSWGTRHYGQAGIPPTAHEGWVITVITSGSPQLIEPSGELRPIPAGTLLVIAPDCVTGWTDIGAAACEQFTFVWRSQPFRTPDNRPDLTIRTTPLDPSTQARLEGLHRQCIEEASLQEPMAPLALEAVFTLIMVVVERAFRSRTQDTDDTARLALAWLSHHWNRPSAVSQLGEYLGLSASTVERRLKKHCGLTASAWIHSHRMQLAAHLLARRDRSIKSIAYELGYAHPGDFSRAWRRWTRSSSRP